MKEETIQAPIFIPLTHVKSADLLVPAVADALKLSFCKESNPKEQLIHYLRDKDVRLVPDHFKHFVEGSGFLSEIWDKAPRVKILVTFQPRLNLKREWVYELRGCLFHRMDRRRDRTPAKLFDYFFNVLAGLNRTFLFQRR